MQPSHVGSMTWTMREPPGAAAPERVRVYWRIRGPNGGVATCALYRTDTGLELRVERGVGELIRSEPVPSEAVGTFRASAWKCAALRLGGFIELPLDAPRP